jgi:hypothetical protein
MKMKITTLRYKHRSAEIKQVLDQFQYRVVDHSDKNFLASGFRHSMEDALKVVNIILRYRKSSKLKRLY